MTNLNNTGDFHGAEIDYGKEYVEIRRLMGLRTTDMGLLHGNAALLWFNCPAHLEQQYAALVQEITQRKLMVEHISWKFTSSPTQPTAGENQ